MNEILNINNVHGYLDKETGTAYLNAEDVARGLGFTTVAKSGNEVVRWARVNTYLHEGVNIITKTPKVAGKGQVYFINKFLKG